ncbi:MAG TPA: formylmethanofuran dehydrogenase [Methanoregula sp.]|jgi:formylmethanofuran dehydrogenase subunit E|nr:formylmethanofuran dehydrogenase [Methanoregula sp.]
MSDYNIAFEKAKEFHGHVCPGIVLGTRLTLAGLRELGMNPHEHNRDLMVFMEIDRCGTDAVQAITGCTLGHRTLKFRDYGKFAATFVNIATGKAVRVAVSEKNREEHDRLEPKEVLTTLALAPDDEILKIEHVWVELSATDIPGVPRQKSVCSACKERIMDGREVSTGGKTLCKNCAGQSYYQILPP